MTNHKHTNRLIHETSPYLLQHAHNPVNWNPWGEEAFAEARRENKPILLSIGYSACHWCHVMEHESFENEDIAALMNENFVNIKVDREERPDLDQIYMNAVQMMTHHGGWPMTVFLTPEGVPYYGGTYFPPEDRHNMPGFPRVLIALSEAYRERPDEIAETTASIRKELERLNASQESSELLTKDLLDTAFRGIVRNYDQINGGFGSAPKFPPAMVLEFLLRTYHRIQTPQALEIVSHTCSKMAEGGIYDQLGGGFHRYSTDSKWLVPHFEKMLYDNALLSRLYLHHYQATGDDKARRVSEGILDYVVREMTAPEGGFYSTQDADSEGVEGKFFVWSWNEIQELLGDQAAPVFCDYYNVTTEGNFEGLNILNVTRSLSEVAARNSMEVDALEALLAASRRKLYEAREKRVKPDRDEKILTAWNGMMLASFAEAGAILERDDYIEVARRNARFILETLRNDGLLLRTYKDGIAKLNGYLEDYAFLSEGLLTLYEATGDLEWLQACLQLTAKMVEEFWDDDAGGFFFTGKSHETLIVRSKDFFDNATPSGNSVAAEVLLRLALLADNEDYRRRGTTILRLMAQAMNRYPAGFGRALGALDFYLSSPKEIAIIGEPKSAATKLLKREVWQRYLPNKVIAAAGPDDSTAVEVVPMLRGRSVPGEQPTAYVCERYVCKKPATNPSELAAQLEEKPLNLKQVTKAANLDM
ncbi:MAG TPA: thioredoxin domain-containing protein [Pyrinomonadaceae bacterium]|nr:thioredoxin domain-containing protein [Pyrinomonadaceae bacterium]